MRHALDRWRRDASRAIREMGPSRVLLAASPDDLRTELAWHRRRLREIEGDSGPWADLERIWRRGEAERLERGQKRESRGIAS